MHFSLIENGIDSLKVTGDILLQYYEDYEFEGYQIKDSVFSFVHSVEVLSKLIIKNKNEELIFRDVDRYQRAKEKVIITNKNNVFEVDPGLWTISVTRAIEILKDGNWELPEDLHDKLTRIILLRNQLMHYTVDMSEDDFLDTVHELRVSYQEMVGFFNKHIPDFKTTFDEVIREKGLTSYEKYLDEIETRALMSHETAKIEAQAEYYETLEDRHRH